MIQYLDISLIFNFISFNNFLINMKFQNMLLILIFFHFSLRYFHRKMWSNLLNEYIFSDIYLAFFCFIIFSFKNFLQGSPKMINWVKVRTVGVQNFKNELFFCEKICEHSLKWAGAWPCIYFWFVKNSSIFNVINTHINDN